MESYITKGDTSPSGFLIHSTVSFHKPNTLLPLLQLKMLSVRISSDLKNSSSGTSRIFCDKRHLAFISNSF